MWLVFSRPKTSSQALTLSWGMLKTWPGRWKGGNVRNPTRHTAEGALCCLQWGKLRHRAGRTLVRMAKGYGQPKRRRRYLGMGEDCIQPGSGCTWMRGQAHITLTAASTLPLSFPYSHQLPEGQRQFQRKGGSRARVSGCRCALSTPQTVISGFPDPGNQATTTAKPFTFSATLSHPARGGVSLLRTPVIVWPSGGWTRAILNLAGVPPPLLTSELGWRMGFGDAEATRPGSTSHVSTAPRPHVVFSSRNAGLAMRCTTMVWCPCLSFPLHDLRAPKTVPYPARGRW